MGRMCYELVEQHAIPTRNHDQEPMAQKPAALNRRAPAGSAGFPRFVAAINIWLNPTDNQGARFNLAAVEAGEVWQDDPH